MEAQANSANYEKTRKLVEKSVGAKTLLDELRISTPIGYAKCFEVVLTSGVEAYCYWETAHVRAVYIGPEDNKSELYDTVRSAEMTK
jgi:hypothetical protein